VYSPESVGTAGVTLLQIPWRSALLHFRTLNILDKPVTPLHADSNFHLFKTQIMPHDLNESSFS
jgi:hypothetical protein